MVNVRAEFWNVFLADRLGIPGDTFMLGTQEFVFSAVLERYPDNASGGFGALVPEAS